MDRGHAYRRQMIVGRTVLIGWGSRLAAIVLSLVNTRLLLELMGAHSYAVYAIFVSLAPWFVLSAMGLPNAAQNLVSELRAAGRPYEEVQGTAANAATWAALVLVIPAIAIAWGLRRVLLPDYEEVGLLPIALMVVALMVNGLCTVFNQLLYADHRGEWPNAAPALMGALSCVCLLLFSDSTKRGLLLGAVSYLVPALIVFSACGRAAGAFRSMSVDLKVLLNLLHRGRPFLLFLAMSTGALSLDYVLMSRILSSTQIVEYNLASKLFGVFVTVQGVLLASSWSRMADLFHQGDFAGLRRAVGIALLAGFSITLLPAAIVGWRIDSVIGLLGGSQAPVPSSALILAWGVLLILRVWSDTFAVATMACGHLSTMNVYIAAQTLISVAGQWWLGGRFGPSGITAGIALSFIVTAAWILPYRFLRLSEPASQTSTT